MIKKLWNLWLKIAKPIGNFQAQALLTLFYIILFWPLGLFFRFLQDPLEIKISGKRSNFERWDHPKENLDEAKKQY